MIMKEVSRMAVCLGPAWMVEGCQGEVHLGHELSALVEVGRGPGIYLVQGAPRHIPDHIV